MCGDKQKLVALVDALNLTKESPGLTEESPEHKNVRMEALIQPLPAPRYTIDVDFSYLEKQLAGYARDWGGLNLEPEFQRGHVWTEAQRAAYIEGIFRGTVNDGLQVIQFNVPQWENDEPDGDLPHEVQIVDGLQRLTTIRMFMANELRAFGMTAQEMGGCQFDPKRSRYRVKFAVHAFTHKSDLLRYYLAINAGGTPHSQDELMRVAMLLDGCRGTLLKP